MTSTLILSFIAGVFAANGTPHFIKGITKEQFPSVFGTSPTVNLIAGWTMYVLTAILLAAAHPSHHPTATLTATATGALLMGLFHATIGAFGQKPTP
jgi:hypothetical protein